MKTTNKILILAGTAAVLFAVGRSSVGWGTTPDASPPKEHVHGEQEEADPALWTCPMHPQIKLPDFGACPICGMDLVEMTRGGDDNPRQLVMSPASKALARIVTEQVRRKNVTRPVRMVGKVDYDETAVRTISAWVAGRIDRLYVDYTGVRVREGDHLVWLYSPDLLTAQEELLSAKARVQVTAGESSEFLASSNLDAYTSSREKLLLWGLTEEQVQEIEDRGTASDRVMLTSPSTGVVIDKMLDEGAYVQTGSHIYRVAGSASMPTSRTLPGYVMGRVSSSKWRRFLERPSRGRSRTSTRTSTSTLAQPRSVSTWTTRTGGSSRGCSFGPWPMRGSAQVASSWTGI